MYITDTSAKAVDRKQSTNLHAPATVTIRSHGTFLFSLTIMLWGLFNIGQEVQLIFSIYKNIDRSLAEVASQASYLLLLQYIFFTSASNFIAAAYGLALLIKPSRLVKVAHFIVGIIILAVSYYINNRYQLTPELVIQTLTVATP